MIELLFLQLCSMLKFESQQFMEKQVEKVIDVDRIMLIVVGAHLAAEVSDRPLAYRLREAALRWIDELETDSEAVAFMPLEPLVCSDLWYLNNEELMLRPTISIGSPGVNAVTAYLANRLPIAFMVENTFQVQLDVEFNQLQACLWGKSTPALASAVDLFIERYLDSFMLKSHGEPLVQ